MGDSRWWQWGVWVPAVALWVAVLWLMFDTPEPQPEPPAPVAAASASRPAQLAASATVPALVVPGGAEPPGAQAVSLSSRSDRPLPCDERDLSRAAVGQSQPEAPQAAQQHAQRAAALQQLVDGLAGGSEVERALGLLLQAQAARAQPGVFAAALADMAQGTREPQVFAMAWQACQAPQVNEPRCELLNAQRLTDLDADNGHAWLALAQEAAERGDQAAVAEAMFRMAGATHVQGLQAAALALVLRPEYRDQAASVRMALLEQFTRVARAGPNSGLVARYCSGPLAQDANRMQVCDRLASLLVERSDTSADFSVGLAVAHHVPWPDGRLAGLDAAKSSYEHTLDARGAGASSCQDVQRQERWVAQLLRAGSEMAALRGATAAAPLAAR